MVEDARLSLGPPTHPVTSIHDADINSHIILSLVYHSAYLCFIFVQSCAASLAMPNQNGQKSYLENIGDKVTNHRAIYLISRRVLPKSLIERVPTSGCAFQLVQGGSVHRLRDVSKGGS